MKSFSRISMILILFVCIGILSQAYGADLIRVNIRGIVISNTGTTFQLEVSAPSTLDWMVLVGNTWVSSSALTGTGNATLNITVAPNVTGMPRQTILRIRAITATPPPITIEECAVRILQLAEPK